MTIIKHRSIRRLPVALPAIAGLEMWERFSFYGMQAILAYYLYSTSGGLGMDQGQATALVGAYGSLLYLCTFVGGWVSDRLLGAERTLLAGAGLLICGHFALSLVPGPPGLVAGLLPLALGSGLLKTAAITILGAAFPPTAGARDGAFQIFYLGINIGALLGPMLTGWLAQEYGYHAGFLAAAGLMCCGCVSYGVLRRRVITEFDSQPPNPTATPGRAAAVALAAVVGSVIVAVAVSPDQLARLLLFTTIAAALALFASMLRSPRVNVPERRRVVAYIPLFLCSTVYWTLQPQIYGVLAVYSDQRVNRMVGGFEIPAAWTQSLNPLFILVLSLPLAAAMSRWARSRRLLMAVGIMVAGSGMFVLLPFVGGGENSTPFMVLAVTIFLMSLGELFIGPVGMAASAAHAPRAYATRFSALYFLTMAIGTSLAGTLSTFYDPSSAGAERTYLLIVGIVPVAMGFLLLVGRKDVVDEVPSGV
ncbi:oligopeptide:H+ symporter [uncultured Corynebacterium sp.]|uniref:peptide MFS transporter n=1 Tax=uncultured Corynebacterium sp. TaxID=159447 RepID=UPI0025DA80F6|nr:oligopeptide:H+ symporter [uncultured Corynebacterium sp.]